MGDNWHLNKTEQQLLSWLLDQKVQTVDGLERASADAVPDFQTDEEGYEAKRVNGGKITVSARQSRLLAESDPVICAYRDESETSVPSLSFRWSEREEVAVGVVVAQTGEGRIVIHPDSPGVKSQWESFVSAQFDGDSEKALTALLTQYRDRPDILHDDGTF